MFCLTSVLAIKATVVRTGCSVGDGDGAWNLEIRKLKRMLTSASLGSVAIK